MSDHFVHEANASRAIELLPSIEAVFGIRLIEYTLNACLDDLRESPEPSQIRTLEILNDMASAIQQIANPLQRRFAHVGYIRTTSERPLSTISQLRNFNGGSFPDLPTESSLESCLIKIAVDLFPALLIIPDNEFTGMNDPIFSFSHVSGWRGDGFASAFLADPELARLFPPYRSGEGHWLDSQPFPGNVVSEVIWSNGSGGTLGVLGIPQSMIEYLFALMRIDNKVHLEYIPEYVANVCRTARQLAGGKSVRLSLVASVSNIERDKDSGLREVTLAEGRLVIDSGLAGVFNHVGEGSVGVLLVETDMKLMDILRIEQGKDRELDRKLVHRKSTFQSSHRNAMRSLLMARMSITLSSTSQVLGPHVHRWSIPNPLSGGAYSSAGEHSAYPTSSAVTITSEVAIAITEWSRKLQNCPEKLELGMRRIVAATTQRIDPSDAFIDAVVCWESLLGTNEGEVTFRVCGALAHLLCPDNPNERVKLYEELRSLYKQRSKLIHGSDVGVAQNDQSNQNYSERRDRAIMVSIQAIRAILSDPRLRENIDSSTRNRILLIGA